MKKYHDSGTICKATKTACPLGGDDVHIEADNAEDFENKLKDKKKNNPLTSVKKKSSIPQMTSSSNVISYNGDDVKNMRRYRTSASVTVDSISDDGKKTNVNVSVYDGET